MAVIIVQTQLIAFPVILGTFSAIIYVFKNALQPYPIIMEVPVLVDALMVLS